MTRAWTRSCAACSVRKGLIFLMLCSANLQDRAVFVMCSLKVSWSSKITPRFLTEADGVIVDEHNWIVKSCCRVGVAGKTRSSAFARLSCRWCSFIHAEMSLRSLQLPLDHLVEMRDRAVCHHGRRSHLQVWSSDVVYVEKRRGPRTDPWGTPETNWCSVDIYSNSKQYIIWVKIIDFFLMPKIIRILISCYMKIFCKCPTVNISKRNFWLVICIAKDFIWTTLKVIFSIFIYFFAPSDYRFF